MSVVELSLVHDGPGEVATTEPVFGTTVLALPAELTLEEWSTLGAQLRTAHNSSAWWVGDWLVYAFQRWQDDSTMRATVLQHLADLGYDLETVERYRRVAALFPPTLRHEALSFSHHVEVSHLELEEAVELLVAAHDQGWSTRKLRDAVRAARAIDVGSTEVEAPEVKALAVRFRGPVSPLVAERLARGIEKTLRELKLDGDVQVR